MTTIEHRQAATLAILADATGPLTARGIAARLRALGHDVRPLDATYAAAKLARAGLVDTRADTLAGTRSRIYWATSAGREDAALLEAQRIDGV